MNSPGLIFLLEPFFGGVLSERRIGLAPCHYSLVAMRLVVAAAVVLAVVLAEHGVLAHIRLAFPPARAPALDFYSSSNSPPPCGVPKPPVGRGLRTFFSKPDQRLKFPGGLPFLTWNWSQVVPTGLSIPLTPIGTTLAFLTNGAIRLEVLNAVDEPIAIFTNFNDPYNLTETTKQVELPENFECVNCAIRITHQATEYSNEYFFYSCADVNILKSIPDGDSCLGNGNRVNGVCECKNGFSGSHCQTESECEADGDCGDDGKCTTTADEPRRQCFCDASRFGRQCEKKSEVMTSLSQFDESAYERREDAGNEIFWRIIKDEIEFVLRFPGESWAAIGWKTPDATCAELTNPGNILQHVASTAVRPKTPAAKPRIPLAPVSLAPNNVTSSDSEEECGPNEMWTKCPESSRECEHSCDWTRFPETTPNCPSTCGAPRCICKEGFVRMSNEEDACVPFDFCDKTAEEEQCPANATWAKCGTACEPTCANMYDTSPCPATCEKAACTCADNYVRHDGRCIYWGDCPELNEKTEQSNDVTSSSEASTTTKAAKTTAESTPTLTATSKPKTSSCAVNETLNECGRVCEADCVTIFTRSDCEDCGAASCACIQGYARNPQGVCVYWGDCPLEGGESTTRRPALQTTKAPPTVKAGKPKVSGDVCYGEYRYPAGCTDCDYKLTWNYVDDLDEIEFSLETRVSGNAWSGVGFSADGSMTDADMLIVKAMDGKLSVHDMQGHGYSTPAEDQVQNVVSAETIGTQANGVLRAQFSRKRNTGDLSDKQFDDKCWKMLFPVAGGKLDGNGNIQIHSNTPLVSEHDVCIRSCQQKQTTKAVPSNTCTNEYRYPADCNGETCEYVARWEYDSAKKDVRFEVSSSGVGRWTGIGFSATGGMTNADIYTGWVHEGKAYVTDRFAYGRQLPAIDPSDRQDIYDVGGNVTDGVQTIWFRRKLTPKDTTTDLPLDQCQYFLYPVGGGRLLAKKNSDLANPRTPIGYHDQFQPQVSPNKICLCDSTGQKVARDSSVPVRVRVRRQAQQNHPMYCTDMVVGMVTGGKARVKDFFSPSKATPRPDSFFGGSDSLTSAAAFQQDGVTTIVFRKKLQATEKWDSSIINGPMTVIWAKGADANHYQHTTGGDPIKSDPLFFPDDSFKYHGRNQRGTLNINFFESQKEKKKPETVHGMHMDENTCTGEYAFPAGCLGVACQYRVSWISDGQVARFALHSSLSTNQWTALGFSNDGNMAASDVIILGVSHDEKLDSTAITVTDQFMPNYGRPIVDEQQDIFDVDTSYVDGILTANFSRELYSDDEHDVNLQECVYLLYAPAGGVIEKNGEIRKHGETPVASKTKICLNTCAEMPSRGRVKETTTTATSTTKTSTTTTTTSSEAPTVTKKTSTGVQMPPMKTNKPYLVYEPEEQVKARYGLRVRILNKEFVPQLTDPQSVYYQSFTKQVTSAIDQLLEKRWKGMRVSKIVGYEKGSVIAEFEVVSIGDVPRPVEVKSMVEENAVRGPISGLSIEPSTVKASEIDASTQAPIEEAMMDVSMWRNIGIIAACSAVLFFVILIFCFVLCRCRRRSSYAAYPVAHPQLAYGNRMLGEKKGMAGFDNAIYHSGGGGGNRHLSQTTSASTKPPMEPNAGEDVPPGGVGETTYQEWYNKVGSKAASQQHEEAPIGNVPSRPPSATPYVSYPNDPSGYYTLGGQHRASSTSQPRYFKPY
ncbi:unnamed protein product [Caenorhabditis auriculariae]|uniref:DOMON domain-containing protein n=1 Tax=Caenorhabditis auriculariae TaxID=2777116 RepID=A0A8S1HRT7_9PELO|nr:unnamed protein product [Caenorhabditis auriculariae]